MRTKLKEGKKLELVARRHGIILAKPVILSGGALLLLAYLRLHGVGADMLEGLVREITPYVIAVAIGYLS